jgi:hypothetical protein
MADDEVELYLRKSKNRVSEPFFYHIHFRLTNRQSILDSQLAIGFDQLLFAPGL